MKLDILAFGAHPDDVELACSGTLMRHVENGCKAGIVDLTRGELGTRGTVETRAKEAEASSKLMGISARENLGFADGFFRNDKDHQLGVIRMIRKYRPEVILANAPDDRHPDHGRASDLVTEAFFLAGLRRIETEEDGAPQEEYRPRALYYYIQDRYLRPDFVVDITAHIGKKMECLRLFSSQFHNPSLKEPETYLSSPYFLDYIKARASEFGRVINVPYAEGFICNRIPGVEDMMMLR